VRRTADTRDTSPSLLERLRRPGEQEAWARFVDLYTPLLYHWARGVGLQPHDAADLVQEVFAALVTKLPQLTYDRSKSFRGWLRAVTLNKWRERCRRLAVPEVPVGAASDVAAPDGEALWEAEYRQHLVARAVEIMRTDFQPATWRACWEVVVAGRPAAEVAAELGLTVGAVHAARFRVTARLREELAGLMD
jgi:RNA polymerase sigma-70 factor (ECF subfamily)